MDANIFAKLVESCTDPLQLAAVMASINNPTGVIRTNEERMAEPMGITPSPVHLRQSVPEPSAVRVIYPHDNERVILTGFSEAELDEKEKQIRKRFER